MILLLLAIDCIKYEIYNKGISSDDSGQRKQWTNFKQSLMNHADSAFHLKAVAFCEKDKAREDHCLKETKTIVSVALTCTYINAASEYFTPLISTLQLSGADVGHIGHSK